MKIGDLVRLKGSLPNAGNGRGEVGLVVGFEGDNQKGWDVFYKILWGSSTTWEAVVNLEIIK